MGQGRLLTDGTGQATHRWDRAGYSQMGQGRLLTDGTGQATHRWDRAGYSQMGQGRLLAKNLHISSSLTFSS